MTKRLSGKSVLRQTFSVGATTMLSQCLGFIRETLLARYLGVSAAADAFNAAWQIPNSLRKIFAEGALSAAFIPTLVGVAKHDGKLQVSRVVTLAIVIIEAILITLCIIMSFGSGWIMGIMAPGWANCTDPAGQCTMAAHFFRILIFFIVFVSTSSLLACALQAVNYFSMLAIAQVLTNILLVGQLWLCTTYDLSLTTYAWFLVANGLVIVLFNVAMYFRQGMTFAMPNERTGPSVIKALGKFFPCIFVFGAVEISLIIDRMLASYLPVGSISLLMYTYAFARIPLRAFAGVFSMILLPQFSRVSTYAPHRLSFYLLESAKFIFWVTVPAALLLSAFSYKLFYTSLLNDRFPLESVYEAHILLNLFSIAIFFLALEKIILNIFYSLHATKMPTVITLIGAAINTVLNIAFMFRWGVRGLIVATVIAIIAKFVIFLVTLNRQFGFTIYVKPFGNFVLRYSIQLVLAGALLYGLHTGMTSIILQLPEPLSYALLWRFAYWFWVGPLCAGVAFLVYATRHLFGIRLYFFHK
jgi:putative peptidoglycan lipid II flippase